MGSATAFFTLFALPAIFFILLNILGIVFNPEIVSGQLFKHLANILGPEVASQVESILSFFQNLQRTWKLLIGGSVFFFIVSTTLFIVIEKSINNLWDIMPRPKHELLSILKKRAIALVVIFIGGILTLLSLLVDIIIKIIQEFLPDIIWGIDVIALAIINRVLAFVMVMLWFTLLFKMIPDARIKWKVAWVGALITTILFWIGMAVLNFIIIGELGHIYGPASAVVSLLLFIFYVSLLIYYGAAFTKVFAVFVGMKVKPAKHAAFFRITIKSNEN